MARLSVSGAGKSFGGRAVLAGNDLSVGAGEIVALLGPSGCGKTTLLRLIAGFERLEAGEIRIDGHLVGSAGLHLAPEKRRVGYVPQEGALFPHLTVAGNILFGLPRRERRREAVADLIAMMGLGGLLDRYPHQLSGGQQQRVALARALAPRPALVALDEPFNALDLTLRRRLAEEVVGILRTAGASALIVTHDPDEAFAAADTLAVMLDGRIMQHDRPETIYRRPASADVAAVTGRVIMLAGTARGESAGTVLGELPLATAMPPGPVTVVLRPEQLVLAQAGAGAGVPVTVVERRFRGSRLLVAVRMDDGRTFRLDVAADADWPLEAHGLLGVRGAATAFAEGKPGDPVER